MEVAISQLNIENLKQEIKNNKGEISKKTEKIENYVSQIKENKSKQDENIKNIDTKVNSQIEESENQIKNLEEKEKKFKEAYDTYIQNKNLAEMEAENLEKVEQCQEKEIKLKKEQAEKTEQIKILEAEISKINIEEVSEKNKINEGKVSENLKSFGSCKEKIKSFEEKIQKYREEEAKIKNIQELMQRSQTKLEKANKIRDNVKAMATQISKYMLENIANLATINFNKITGRTERIFWSNDDENKDKYEIYLLGQDSKLEFENLSGGEQVSVAISMRGAMTKFFSNSKFIILDEPTNNLDVEKRKLLSEYIGEILVVLEQSIIVTHDDTFREMAEKIIEF